MASCIGTADSADLTEKGLCLVSATSGSRTCQLLYLARFMVEAEKDFGFVRANTYMFMATCGRHEEVTEPIWSEL